MKQDNKWNTRAYQLHAAVNFNGGANEVPSMEPMPVFATTPKEAHEFAREFFPNTGNNLTPLEEIISELKNDRDFNRRQWLYIYRLARTWRRREEMLEPDMPY